MSAVRLTAEAAPQKYAGEVQDYSIQWSARMAPARVSATGANGSATGAWSVAGETASAFVFYPASGISASALSTTALWSAWNSASGEGLTGTGSASALYSLVTTFRISGGSASDRPYTCSAELRTSSGRYLYERFNLLIRS